MVLRLKEREGAIQLLVMDLQVYGKLLTFHWKGNKVDVEALHDGIPLRQGAEKGPQMGSHGYRRLRRWKSVFMDSSGGLGIYGNIQAKELGQEGHRGPTRVGGALPPGLALHPRGCLVASPSSSPGLPGLLLVQERSSQKFHSVWTPFSIPFLQNYKIGKKLALGLRLIGQSQK